MKKQIKMRKLKITLPFIISGIALLASLSAGAQDIHYSQFTRTPLLLNPAQAGDDYYVRAIMNYKNQWSSVAEAYKTYNFSYDMILAKKKDRSGYSAIGTDIFSDNSGDANMKTFNAGLTYAYHVNLSEKSRLGGGITAAYVQRSVNTGNYQWANQYNGMEYDAGISPDESITTPSRSYLDLAGGVHWGYRKSERYMTGNDQLAMNAGVSMFHMTNPRYSFCGSGERLNSKVVMYFNAVIGISNTKNSVLPGYAMFLQGKSNEILMGALYRYQFQEDSKYTGNIKASAISFGGYYRNRDAFIAKVMYEFSQYSIGVSYDINVSGLKKASNGLGGVEISLRFTNAAPFLYKNKASI